MRYETTTTAFVYFGSHRDGTNARVEGSVSARFLPGIYARVWQAVHSCMLMLQGRHSVPAMQPVLCLSAPCPMAYPGTGIAELTPRLAAGKRLG
jgi:hypothetical protein